MKGLIKGFAGTFRATAGEADGMSALVRLRWIGIFWVRRLDWPGTLAIGVMVMCSAFYFSAVRPEQSRLDLASENISTLKEQLSIGSKSSSGKDMSLEDQLAAFYLKFPDERTSPKLLEKLMYQATRNGLSLNDGEYKVTRDTVGRLIRYQVTLKVNGEFTKIRQFLNDLSTALPVAGIESVQFQRQSIAEGSVESKIKLVIFMEQAT